MIRPPPTSKPDLPCLGMTIYCPTSRDAVAHVGSHARLIAGPGTGKTYVLAGRVLNLVREQ